MSLNALSSQAGADHQSIARYVVTASVHRLASPAAEPLLNAYYYLKEGGILHKRILKGAPTELVKQTWKHSVFQEDGQISKQGYCLYFLSQLQGGLRRRNLFLEESNNWVRTTL